jgi:hypothetical protein
MMTSARVAAQSTEFVFENFAAKDFQGRTEVWDNGSIVVSHTVTLPVGNVQAVIRVIADEKTVSISMTLCSDSQMTTTSLSNQNEIRPEEFTGLLDHHLRTLMDLADEYLERVATGGNENALTVPLDPNGDTEPPF